MIRTILFSATILAFAGAATAGEVKVSLTGKTEAAIKVELAQAAKLACSDVSIMDYAPCVDEAYHEALATVAKAKAIKTASMTF